MIATNFYLTIAVAVLISILITNLEWNRLVRLLVYPTVLIVLLFLQHGTETLTYLRNL